MVTIEKQTIRHSWLIHLDRKYMVVRRPCQGCGQEVSSLSSPYSSDTPPRSSNKKKQTVVLKVNEDTSALNLVQRLRGALASLKKEAQSETKTDLTVQHIPFINDDKAIRNRHYFKTESFSQTPLYVNSTWKRRKK